MKVRVDQTKCQGHARCYTICPDVFYIDEVEDRSHVKSEDVPARLEDRVRNAEQNCPEQAITVW